LARDNIWHTSKVEDIFEKLDTDQKGLTSVEAEKRLRKHGLNQLGEEKGVNKFALLLSQIKNPLLIVLVVVAIISFMVNKLADTVVVASVIVFNTAIGFFQEYKAETALRSLKSMAAPEAEVIRDCPERGTCVEMQVKAKEIVPGDILILSTGDKVPADSRIFEISNLEIDESMLTGESKPVRKTVEPLDKDTQVADRTNMLFSGTIVTNGRGKAVVVATGMQTEVGKIAKLIEETEEIETPIQKRTRKLTKKLGLLALIVSALTFTIGLLQAIELYEIFLFSLASAVSSIPEGLPAVMTITLAVGVNRMVKRNAIIRKLQAVDTLGSATVICTDKTGTLTTNQMTVQKIWVDNRLVDVTGVGYAPEGHFEIDDQRIEPNQDQPLSLLLQAGVLCNDAKLRQRETDDDYRWEISGDPTEGALVVVAQKAGLNKYELEEKIPRIDEIPFSSEKRYMVTFHEKSNKDLEAYVKGAPKKVLDMCSEYLEGERKTLTEEKKEKILEINTKMANEALRVLALAYQKIPKDSLDDSKKKMRQKNSELIFLGLVGMIDPPRPEVKKAVERCRNAGIKVIMSTGDHKLTAEAIARDTGILLSNSKVFTGEDIEGMSNNDLDSVIDDVSVFARVSPTHKHRIVKSLRRKGHVVTMTGDGVNDAPALKAADIGVSMGITGTDVTKETADMVLVDDNFVSIVNAIEEGRVVFENVRKVVKYLLSTNIGEDITILTTLIFLQGSPLIFTPVQILWVNLVTDGILDVTLAMEPKEDEVMYQPPRKPTAGIINREILLNIIYVGIFMMLGTLWLFSKEWNMGNTIKAQTLAFTALAMFQVFNSLNCRSRTKSIFKLGFFRNKYLLVAIGASLFLQVLATVWSPLQFTLGTTALSLWDWVSIILISSSIFFADETRKLIINRFKK